MTPGLDRRKRAALPTSIFAGELKALTVWQWATSAGARIPIPRLLPFVMQPKAINISTVRPGPRVGFPTPSSARWRNCLSRWKLAVSRQLAGATISKPWRSLKPRTAVSNKGDQSKSAKSSGRNEFHIDRTKKFIDLAYTWGAKNVLLVLGEYMWQREVIPSEAQWRWALETCREIGRYADRKEVDIALELEPFRLSLLNDVDAMARFVDECDNPRIRANIDISHLVLSDSSPAELKKLKGKAIHVHLSDCDGKVHGDLPPGHGVVKFGPYLQAIKELKMDGAVSIELEYSPNPGRIVEWVEEAYRETAKLMALAGLRN